MGHSTDVYIFGDQTVCVDEGLQDLLLVGDNISLQNFLNGSFLALRREISSLPTVEKNVFPSCESLGLLLESFDRGERHAALDSSCTCIYEIGYYIYLLAEKNVQHPPPTQCLVGVCTGSFAAAAVSCSRTIDDLCRLGIQAVVIAFRVGMQVHKRAELLERQISSRWSIVVSGISEETATQAIDEFYAERPLPTLSQPFISAVGTHTVTITGPPEVLDAVLLSPRLSGKKSFQMPLRGPYHAPHLYPATEMEQILLSTLRGIEWLDRVTHTPNISCATGSLVNGDTYGTLLKTFIADVLARQIRIDSVIDGLVEPILAAKTGIKLVPINAQFASSLATSLIKRGCDVQIEKTVPIRRPPTNINNTHLGTRSPDIAVIGFSGRFPEADGLAEFWDLLQKGLDVHKPIPADRFDGEAHYDATGQRKNTSRVMNGCWIKEPGLFDSRFFHMSPREACQSDPAQRLALLTAYEALEMAGLVPDRTASTHRHRIGVFYGTTSDDWREVNSGQDVDTYFIPGGNRAFIPGRINYHFKFSGPSVSVDTACSSSLAAINIACMSLLKRDCDTAIAGGTNVMTNPDNFAGLDRGHFLSRTGNCKTFDDEADGYCRADGVGTVILKRVADAISDNDPIFGVIRGTHTNHSAEAVSITRPLAEAQEYLFKKLLNESGIKPHDIGYIEMHGTGTQAGDAVEMRSVLNTFAWDHSRQADKKLYLGSVKSNVGHGESASGVTALIKVLLMMQKDKIPPHCGIKGRINHGFPTDLKERGVCIPLQETDWPRPQEGRRRVFVNNFSAAGGNTALLLEDAPKREADTLGSDPRTYHVVAVSSTSPKSLTGNLTALADFIGASTSRELLAQISYTTTARRIHHNRRVAFVVSDLQQLKRSLLHSAETDAVRPIQGDSPGVGFLFTGQGGQYTAMAHQLYEQFSSFRSDINDFDGVARGQGLPSILPLVRGTMAVENLSATVIQLGTCIIQLALARLWINLGAKPRFVIGHSLGEYAALQIAGVLSISDVIYLVGHRAVLLEKGCTKETHGMVAVQGSESQLRQIIAGTAVEVACINGVNDTVISGRNDAIKGVCQRLTELGYKFTKLVLPFAFHSSQVDPILDSLAKAACRIKFKAPTIPVVSTLLGSAVMTGDVFGPDYLRRQCRETVNFLGAMDTSQREGIFNPRRDICIEIGTHSILTRMVKAITGPEIRCYASLRRGEDVFKSLPESLAAMHSNGMAIKWDEYHRDFASCHKVIDLPGYKWDLSNHWMQYEHNWCLAKGSPTEASVSVVAPVKSARLSASAQVIIEQAVDDDHGFIVIQSDLHDPELLPVARDHRVNGLILTPSSLYADIAYTLSKHLLAARYPGQQEYMPDICNMVVEKALVYTDGGGPQQFRAAMTIRWTSKRGSMEIYSVDKTEKRTITHAKCDIEFHKPQVWLENWQRLHYLIQRSYKQLLRGVEDGSAHKIRRGMAYKLFSSCVEYGPAYQGIEEVVFDTTELEATARVCLQPTEGNFALNPFWIDSFGHLTGFLMNSNDSLELTDHVFVNHGWAYMRVAEQFDRTASYRTYVKMQSTREDKSSYSGDVYILRDNKVVAVYGSVTFNRVSKRVLDMILASSKGKNSQPRPARQLPNSMSSVSGKVSSEFPLTTKKPAIPTESIFQKALRVISDEIGIEPDQLTDESHFSDMGVDSLMSLTILEAFREDLGIDASSSFLIDYPSVKALQDYLCTPSSSDESEDGTSSPNRDDITTTPSSTAPTPESDESKGELMSGGAESTIGFIFAILAEEAQVGIKELSTAETLAEIGVDSIMSLTVQSRASEELGIDLPHDIFLQHAHFSDVKAALHSILSPNALPVPISTHQPPATSVILQGAKTSTKTLFLFPDGSGSATSYATLPVISSDLRLVGLNCPYLKSPKSLTCSLQDLTGSYIAEIRRRQPTGPYIIGGWSAGGIAAYDAAMQLVAEGETVDKLILLDSPNPIGLEKLPPRFYRFLEEQGVFGSSGGQKAPEWLIEHFLAFIDALDKWKPVPFKPTGAAPKTVIIWARDGVCNNADDPRPEPQPGDPKEMHWLLENRTELGANGWDQLLPGGKIEIKVVDGANHFSMVREPKGGVVASLIREALTN